MYFFRTIHLVLLTIIFCSVSLHGAHSESLQDLYLTLKNPDPERSPIHLQLNKKPCNPGESREWHEILSAIQSDQSLIVKVATKEPGHGPGLEFFYGNLPPHRNVIAVYSLTRKNINPHLTRQPIFHQTPSFSVENSSAQQLYPQQPPFLGFRPTTAFCPLQNQYIPYIMRPPHLTFSPLTSPFTHPMLDSRPSYPCFAQPRPLHALGTPSPEKVVEPQTLEMQPAQRVETPKKQDHALKNDSPDSPSAFFSPLNLASEPDSAAAEPSKSSSQNFPDQDDTVDHRPPSVPTNPVLLVEPTAPAVIPVVVDRRTKSRAQSNSVIPAPAKPVLTTTPPQASVNLPAKAPDIKIQTRTEKSPSPDNIIFSAVPHKADLTEQEQHKQKEEEETRKRDAERARLRALEKKRKEAEQKEKAALADHGIAIEEAYRKKQFAKAFELIQSLDQKTPFYTKTLITLVRALTKERPADIAPDIIQAIIALYEKKTQDKYVVHINTDRILLSRLIAKYSPDTQTRKTYLKAAADLGDSESGFFWHLVQMNESTTPCTEQTCSHQVAREFFESHTKDILTSTTRYLALVRILSCPKYANNRTLREKTLAEIKKHLTAEECEMVLSQMTLFAPEPTPEPVQEKPTRPLSPFGKCRKAVQSAIETGQFQAGATLFAEYLQEQIQQDYTTALKMALRQAELLVQGRSYSVDEELEALLFIEGTLVAFKGMLPLESIESLRLYFTKIPYKESATTPQEAHVMFTQKTLQTILNPFFVKLGFLRRECEERNAEQVIDEKLQNILTSAKDMEDIGNIVRPLNNTLKTEGENSFSPVAQKFIFNYVTDLPDASPKKELWERYALKDPAFFFKVLKNGVDKRETPVQKVYLIRKSLIKLIEFTETPDFVQITMQALEDYSTTYRSPDFVDMVIRTFASVPDTLSSEKRFLWSEAIEEAHFRRFSKGSWCTLL